MDSEKKIQDGKNADSGIRLQKYISECGVMSRRSAEREIEAGTVTVNGKCVRIGDKIDPGCDTVCIRGEEIKISGKKTITVMLNKPAGYITTLSDEHDRKCVEELISDYGVRLNPVGRLDKDSEGLLLFTNDGELLQHLTHPRYSLPKVYNVMVNSAVNDAQLSRLRAQMVIDGYKLRPVETEIISIPSNNCTVLSMTLHEGRNRQIRKMCAQVGLSVTGLRRVAIGKLNLGGLRPGSSKLLTQVQLRYLYNAVGLQKKI